MNGLLRKMHRIWCVGACSHRIAKYTSIANGFQYRSVHVAFLHVHGLLLYFSALFLPVQPAAIVISHIRVPCALSYLRREATPHPSPTVEYRLRIQRWFRKSELVLELLFR